MKRYFSLFILILALWGGLVFEAFALSITPGKLIIANTEVQDYSFTIIRDDYREKEILDIDVNDPSGMLDLDTHQQLVLGRGEEKYEFSFTLSDNFDVKEAQTAIINLTPEVQVGDGEDGVVNVVSAVGLKVEYNPDYVEDKFLQLGEIITIESNDLGQNLEYTISNTGKDELFLESRYQERHDGVVVSEEVDGLSIPAGSQEVVLYSKQSVIPGQYTGVFSVKALDLEGSSVSERTDFYVRGEYALWMQAIMFAMVILLALILLLVASMMFRKISRRMFGRGVSISGILLLGLVAGYGYLYLQNGGQLVAMDYDPQYMKIPAPGYIDVSNEQGHRLMNLKTADQTQFDGKWSIHIASHDRYFILNERNEGYLLRQQERTAVRVPVVGAVTAIRSNGKGYIVQNSKDELFYYDRQFMTEGVPVRVQGDLINFDAHNDIFVINGSEGSLSYNPQLGKYEAFYEEHAGDEASYSYKQYGDFFYGKISSRAHGMRKLPDGVSLIDELGGSYYLAEFNNDVFVVDFRTNRMMYIMTKKDSDDIHYLSEGSAKTPRM